MTGFFREEYKRKVVKQKGIMGSRTPLINFRFIVMKDNEHEIPAVRELTRSLGVDALTFKALNPSFNHGFTPVHDDQFMPENAQYRRFVYGENGSRRIRSNNNPCKNLWNCVTVHWRGVICPCCRDPHGKYAVGDLQSDSFTNNWSGELFRRMRKRFRLNWEEIPLCRDCTNAFKGGSANDETIAEAIFFTPEQGGDNSLHG